MVPACDDHLGVPLPHQVEKVGLVKTGQLLTSIIAVAEKDEDAVQFEFLDLVIVKIMNLEMFGRPCLIEARLLRLS